MNRGVALTLGTALVLGGAIGAQSQDLSGWVDARSDAPAFPSWGGVLPTLPENWSDLPVQFRVSETLGYNSNILGLPSNSALLGGLHQGDFQSISSYGVSTKANWQGQQFFADGSYGFTRYLHDVSLNSAQNSADIGVNWIYTSRCSGTLVAAESLASSPFGQQVISTSTINNVSTVSFNESAKCLISGEYSAVFNSGFTRTTNSTIANQPNNSRSVFIAAGINYAINQLDSIQALLTITGTDFTDRSPALNSIGLVNALTQDQIGVTYTKQINPKLSFVASIGLIGSKNGSSFTLAIPSGVLPTYSASVNWAATPKLNVSASVARTVSPPQNVIGNIQSTESATFGLNYLISPKVTLNGAVSVSYSSAAFTQVGTVLPAGVSPFALTSQKSYSAEAGLAYSVTPFIGANLTYQYSRLTQPGLVTPQSTVMLNVNYNPH